MNCEDARDAIVVSFDDADPDPLPPALNAHITTCEGCARFLRTQRTIDQGMMAAFANCEPPPSVTRNVRIRLTRVPESPWRDLVPDISHFATCAGATVACMFVVPLEPRTILLGGTAMASLTYVALTMARSMLEQFGVKE